MRFTRLEVSNLRAVDHFFVDDLTNFVMIAGQNGSGKSCVFDAVRLLKSVYGGYQPDEHMQWFGEFSINLQDRHGLRKLFRDPTKDLVIQAELEFADSEALYLQENLDELAWPLAWQRVTGQKLDPWTFNRIAIATQVQQYKAPIEAELAAIRASVTNALRTPGQQLGLRISPAGQLTLVPSPPAEVAFQAYRPEHLGIIEYHSASRTYTRQEVGGVTLDTRQFADQRRQQSLYNWQGKYQNIKTELATAYIRNLISGASGSEAEDNDINRTLQQLFQTFFPDKSYEGVRPIEGGNLEFPVRLSTGQTHDIDDLSSGEKEILYGYLRLRNATPRHSIVLLDEPELHLNPSLLQGFTDFYHEYLGRAQDNQLWLVTHSDALLRQTVGNTNYRVYHMLPAATIPLGGNQAAEVILDDDVEKVTVDLVGDLASYRPHAKVVILEGDTPSGIDISMIRRLFPGIARRINLVNGGPKRRVRDLYRVLANAAESSGIQNRFFAITDADSEVTASPAGLAPQEFSWDVYHIENYLLDPTVIRAAAISLSGSDQFGTDGEVELALKRCAEILLDRLVLERVQDEINRRFTSQLKIGASPDTSDVARDILPSVESSVQRIVDMGASLDAAAIQTLVEDYRSTLESSLHDGSWIRHFPGRLILHRFADQHLNHIKYETLANVILDKMVEARVEPGGMRSVLDRIMAA